MPDLNNDSNAEGSEDKNSEVETQAKNEEVVSEEEVIEDVQEDQDEGEEQSIQIVADVTESTLEGSKWKVRIIRSGWSKNGNYYPKDVLKRDFKNFDNIPVAIYGEKSKIRDRVGHLPRGARAKISQGKPGANYVGWIENPTVVETQEGVSVLGDMYLVEDDLKSRLLNAAKLGNYNFLGLSIDSRAFLSPYVAEGRRGFKVGALPYAREVTLVDRPAAGGALLDVVAGLNDVSDDTIQSKIKRENITLMWEKILNKLGGEVKEGATAQEVYEAAISKFVFSNRTINIAKTLSGRDNYEAALIVLESAMDEVPEDNKEKEVEQTKVEETKAEDTQKAESDSDESKAALAEVKTIIQQLLDKQNEQAAQMEKDREDREVEKCQAVAESMIETSGLPAQFKNILKKNFAGRKFEKEELEGEIASIQEALSQSGLSVNQGQRFSSGAGSADKLKIEMLRAWGFDFDQGKENGSVSESEYEHYLNSKNESRLPSIQRVYKNWMDDHSLNFTQPGMDSVQEATTSDLSYAIANTLGRAVQQRMETLGNLWEPLVKINPGVSDFRLQTRVRRHGLGGVYSVSESDSADTYTETGTPYDGDAETYTVSTYGTMTTVTRKMIIDDDMGFIQDIPRSLAGAYQHFVQEKIFDILIGNAGGSGVNTDTMSDSVVIYHANHRNTGTTAFSHAALNTALEAISNQREFGRRTQITDDPLSNSATTINVDSTVGFRAGDFVLLEAEIVKIGTVASTTQFTGCSRAQLGTTAASHVDNTVMWQLVRHLTPMRYYLVYPYELSDEVFRVLNSQKVSGIANNDANMFFNMGGRMIMPHPVPNTYLRDSNNWYLMGFPNEIPTAEVAFLNDQRTPEFFTQNDPTVGNVFTRDNVRIKGRIEFGGATLEFRGLYGSIVA